VCDFAFYKIGLHRIVADYYNENVPSSKIFEKGGFAVEGIFKDHFFYNGKYTDSIRMGLINPKE
jgi:RimJ/RimL family protein N-acetyltransferase